MTVEDFHDALTLLPADLVAEADERRFRKPRLVLWHRWAAMAACLVLVLSCGLLVQSWKPGKSQSNGTMAAPAAGVDAAPAEAAPALSNEKAALDEAAPYSGGQSRSNTMDSGTFAPGILDITWVETPAEDAFAMNISGEPETALIQSREMLEAYLAGCVFQNVEALRKSTEAFDEGWFSTHDLLMLRLVCSAEAAVTDIEEKEGRWEIYVEEKSPESPASEYHILITVEKGLIDNADDVTLLYAVP